MQTEVAPEKVRLSDELGLTVGDTVMLRADLYDGPDDHHPGGYLATKGEKLIVRKLQTDYVLPWSDPLCINVSHEDRTDGLTFVVRLSEIEPWQVTPRGVTRPATSAPVT